MSDRSKLRPNNHFLAYEAAEAACMEKYPKIQVIHKDIIRNAWIYQM